MEKEVAKSAPAERRHEEEKETESSSERPEKPLSTQIQVKIESSPPGATVLIDRKEYGVTPLTITLEPGPHGIEIRKEGYKPLWEVIRAERLLAKNIIYQLELE